MIDYRTFQSAGKLSSHIIPGAYSRIDSVKGAGGLVSANNGVVMGQCTGGQPTTLLQFNTVAEAIGALRGGPLMEAVRLAFDPGGGVNPQRVFAMRVNNAVQGSVYLLDGSTNNMIKLTSLDYGLYVNQIKVILAAGTVQGKKLTVQFKSEDDEVFDDIYRASMTIQYSAGACTMTIVNNSGAQTLTSSVGGLSIDLNDYPTVGDLAAYINDQTNFSCNPQAGQEGASSLYLDAVSAVDINSAPYVAQSTFQAIIDTVNAGSARLSAAAANAANDRVIPANLALTYLTGGTEGSYTSTQWSDALTALEAENVQFISTPDTSAAVHAAIKTHCQTMSSVTGRGERQFLLGAPWKTGTLATEIATAVSAAQTLNSVNGMYVFNGGTQRDVNGTVQNYDASYGAVMLMAQKTALSINQPLTFKGVNFIELEWKLSDPNLESLLKWAVAPIAYAPNGTPRLTRQLNTYQTNDLKFNEFSSVTEMFFASRDLRTYLEDRFVGQPGTALVNGVLKGAVESRLQRYEDLGIFIRNPEEERAWWNVVISISGDTVYIDYDAYITLPVNFEFITNHFHEMVASA
jgi:hypothetical protein